MSDGKFVFPRDSTKTRGAVKLTHDGSDFYVPAVLHGSDGTTAISASNPLPTSFLVMPDNAAFKGSSNMVKTYDRSMFAFGIKNKHTAVLSFTINGNEIEIDGKEGWFQTFNPFTTVTITASGPFKAFALTYPNFTGVIIPNPPDPVEPSIPDTTPPNEVTGLAVSSLTHTGLTLSWVASTSLDIASYKIYNGAQLLTTITGTAYNVTGLAALTSYTLTVKAVDTTGNVSAGVSVQATTTAVPVDTTIPDNVASVSISNITTTGATLSWPASASSNVSGYDIHKDGVFVTTVSILTYSISGLTASTNYTYTVKSRSATGYISTGTSKTFTTSAAVDTTAPNPVTSLTAGTPTSSSVPLTWTLSASGDVATQEIAYSTDGTTFTVASAVVSAVSTTYSVTGLLAATAYTFRVVAVDTSSNRSTDVTTTATTAAISGKVTSGLVNEWSNLTSQTTLNNDGTYYPATGEFTVYVMLKPKAYLNILSQFNVSSPATSTVRFYLNDTGQKVDVNSWGTVTGGTEAFPAGETTSQLTNSASYYHVALVRNNTANAYKIFINNVEIGSYGLGSGLVLHNNITPPAEVLKIGDAASDIKHLLYYNRLLTTAELTQNYNNIT